MVASALIGALRVSLGLDSARFEEGAKRARQQLPALQQSFQRVGGAMQGIGAGMMASLSVPFSGLMAVAVPAAVESRQALAQVEAAQKSMGNAAKLTTAELQAMAGALQDTSNFDDDDILKEVTANLLTFGNISGEVFKGAQQAAVDMSARMGTSLQGAAIMLGKALNDPAKGVAKLTRVGVQFTDQQKEQITAMTEAGNVAGAQAVMLAELERQFGGAAAAQRAATPDAAMKQAWRDFQETVGGIALQVLPKLTNMLGGLLNAFNNLSPGVQTFIVGAAAILAGLGPVLLVLGSLINLAAPLAGMLATTASAAIATGGAGGGAAVGLQAFAVGLRAIMVSLGPIALALGAAYLIWKNWDKLAPIFNTLKEAFMGAFGPALQETLTALKAALTQLWDGPFGSAVRTVMGLLGQFSQAYTQVLGAGLITLVKGLGSVLGSVFSVIGGLITTLAKLLSGDFSGAWQSAQKVVLDVALAIPRALNEMTNGGVVAVLRMVDGIRDAIVNKLSAIWESGKAKIQEVKQAFHDLWDAVVGHSYIPDMVTGIGQWMGRLQQLMVEPGKKATEATKKAFEALGKDVERVKGILASVFPEETRARELADDIAFLQANAARLGISANVVAEAVRRMNDELNGTAEKARAAKEEMDRLAEQKKETADKFQGLMDEAFPEEARARKHAEDIAFLRANFEALGVPIERVNEAVAELDRQFKGLPRVVPVMEVIRRNAEELGRTINDTLANGIKGMIRGSMSWKDVMLDAIFAIADALINTLFDAINKTTSDGGGGIGGVLGTIFKDVLGGLFAKGGRPPTGKVSLVGEQGPELFVPDTAGRVIPNHALGERQAPVVRLMVGANDYFDAKVEQISGGVILQQAPALVTAAQQSTIRQLSRRRMG